MERDVKILVGYLKKLTQFGKNVHLILKKLF